MGLKNLTGLVLLSLAVIVLPYALPDFYFKLIQIGIYALICIGLSLLLGYAGQISLGHAAFYALGAYTSAILTVRYGWSPWLAVWVGIGLTIILALAIGIPSLRLQGHYLAMATLAFGEIAFVVATAWVALTGGPSGFGHIPKWNVFGYRLVPPRADQAIFYFVWAAVILGLLVALNLINSRVGRALRAIHDGEQAADVLGIPTATYKIKIFVLSAAYASVAGSIYAHVSGYVNPGPFSVEHSILFITMVIVGGMRTVWGGVAGACLMGLLPELLADLEHWRFAIYGLILLIIMMFIPQGILLGVRDLIAWSLEKLPFRKADSPGETE
ncbi:branched-chain amino acid ABC transporter permease [bacterium]|nr:branched-chain amino acid ABC transporter permease [bacterium]